MYVVHYDNDNEKKVYNKQNYFTWNMDMFSRFHAFFVYVMNNNNNCGWNNNRMGLLYETLIYFVSYYFNIQ